MALKLTSFSISKSNTFAEISRKGLFIYNSPNEYIKFGSGEAELKSSNMIVNNLTILGDLLVYGGQTTGATSSSLAGTFNPTFSIGSSTVSGEVSLLLGNFADTPKLYTNGGTNLKLNRDLVLDTGYVFKQNGVAIGTFVVEELTLSVDIPQDTAIVIPNNSTYILSANKLFVFVDGKLQSKTDHFYENSANSIKFKYDLIAGATIIFLIIGW